MSDYENPERETSPSSRITESSTPSRSSSSSPAPQDPAASIPKARAALDAALTKDLQGKVSLGEIRDSIDWQQKLVSGLPNKAFDEHGNAIDLGVTKFRLQYCVRLIRAAHNSLKEARSEEKTVLTAAKSLVERLEKAKSTGDGVYSVNQAVSAHPMSELLMQLSMLLEFDAVTDDEEDDSDSDESDAGLSSHAPASPPTITMIGSRMAQTDAYSEFLPHFSRESSLSAVKPVTVPAHLNVHPVFGGKGPAVIEKLNEIEQIRELKGKWVRRDDQDKQENSRFHADESTQVNLASDGEPELPFIGRLAGSRVPNEQQPSQKLTLVVPSAFIVTKPRENLSKRANDITISSPHTVAATVPRVSSEQDRTEKQIPTKESSSVSSAITTRQHALGGESAPANKNASEKKPASSVAPGVAYYNGILNPTPSAAKIKQRKAVTKTSREPLVSSGSESSRPTTRARTRELSAAAEDNDADSPAAGKRHERTKETRSTSKEPSSEGIEENSGRASPKTAGNSKKRRRLEPDLSIIQEEEDSDLEEGEIRESPRENAGPVTTASVATPRNRAHDINPDHPIMSVERPSVPLEATEKSRSKGKKRRASFDDDSSDEEDKAASIPEPKRGARAKPAPRVAGQRGVAMVTKRAGRPRKSSTPFEVSDGEVEFLTESKTSRKRKAPADLEEVEDEQLKRPSRRKNPAQDSDKENDGHRAKRQKSVAAPAAKGNPRRSTRKRTRDPSEEAAKPEQSKRQKTAKPSSRKPEPAVEGKGINQPRRSTRKRTRDPSEEAVKPEQPKRQKTAKSSSRKPEPAAEEKEISQPKRKRPARKPESSVYGRR
ncbi:unnamed protein product [Periconia digitata]|uniref:Uncharacterized protein n=1 Tax=Periconia digitata TaxID=1303443 RepID=A0A9W4XLN9_9PLEO|nr:unnamed protein product [Periconia digitata]